MCNQGRGLLSQAVTALPILETMGFNLPALEGKRALGTWGTKVGSVTGHEGLSTLGTHTCISGDLGGRRGLQLGGESSSIGLTGVSLRLCKWTPTGAGETDCSPGRR